MCRGISIIVTPAECYWSPDNSHETIKKEYNLRDEGLIELLIVELYPRGQRLLSEKEEDWELITENNPEWYLDNREEINSRIYRFLFGVIFPRIIVDGLEVLDLTDLAYSRLPDWCGVRIKELHCGNNRLQELTVPEGIKNLYCSYNKLKELSVPAGIIHLDCSYNQLQELTVPEGIKNLYCSYNPPDMRY